MHSEFGNGSSNTEAVTAELRELIMKGTLVQGERLTETGLAARLKVSRTPVRLGARHSGEGGSRRGRAKSRLSRSPVFP